MTNERSNTNSPFDDDHANDAAASPDNSHGATATTAAADANIARLLAGAYEPQPVDAAFARRVESEMRKAAKHRTAEDNWRAPASGWLALAAAVAVVAGLAVQVVTLMRGPVSPSDRTAGVADSHSRANNATDRADDARSDRPIASRSPRPFTHLQPQQRPAPTPAKTLGPGDVIETTHGEKRRVTLADGSTLFVNERSRVRIDGERGVTLEKGEVYVEVAPRDLRPADEASAVDAATLRDEKSVADDTSPNAGRATFTLVTPTRRITAFGTKFAVSTSEENGDADVLVTQGKVRVEGERANERANDHKEQNADASPAIEVLAGQRLLSGRAKPQAAERASHPLSWTADLIAAAETALVPASDYAGGALVIADEAGNEGRLSLTHYHIDVHIEDGFARTTIDQMYFNHEHSRQEGTFYFPLPPDASISRLAMYVGRRLMEGGMAERQHARNVFETIRHARRDPALLEWLDGSTFKMRVFPLEPREHKRIILSYTQQLDEAYGRTTYRFPAGHSLGLTAAWSFHARIVNGAEKHFASPGRELRAERKDGDLHLTAGEVGARTGRDVVLQLFDRKKDEAQRGDVNDEVSDDVNGESDNATTNVDAEHAQANAAAAKSEIRNSKSEIEPPTFRTFLHEGHRYLLLRHRPALDAEPVKPRRHWVFLFESSADRDPLLARVQIDVIRHLLENAEHDDTFQILAANTRVQHLAAAPLRATPANIKHAVATLDRAHLIGALDLENAFREAAKAASAQRESGARNDRADANDAENGDTATSPELRPPQSQIGNRQSKIEITILHVGSAIPVLGERDTAKLLDLLPDDVRYVGVGIGNRYARAFMQQAAARTGGYATQINPDQRIAWRSFELLSKLNAPRLLNIAVQAGDASGPPPSKGGAGGGCAADDHTAADNADDVESESASPFLLFTPTLSHGESLTAVTRLPADAPLPAHITITGRLNGKPYRQTLAVTDPRGGAGYLPRFWAKLEIDRLLTTPDHRDRVVALSKAMYVMSPYTSLLVLENDAMYTQYNVDRGRKDHWALYPAPEMLKRKPGAPEPVIVMNEKSEIDLHVKDEPIDELLPRLARATDRSIVLAPGVTGEITTDLYAVDFHEALDAILQPNGFGYREKDGIVYVYTQGQFEGNRGDNGNDQRSGDVLAHARQLLIDEKIAAAKQAEANGNFRVAVNSYEDALALSPGNEELTQLRDAVMKKAESALGTPASPLARMTRGQITAEAAEVEYESLMGKADRFRAEGSYELAQEAIQQAKVVIDRRRQVLGPTEYEALRTRANDAYDAVSRQRREAMAQWSAAQAADDAGTARVRRARAIQEQYGQVQRLLRRALELRKTQDYEGSLQLVNQALFLDPNNAGAQAMKIMLEDSAVLVEAREYLRLRDLRVAKHEMEMIEATVPYNELMTYPSDWPELTQMRMRETTARQGRGSRYEPEALWPGLAVDGVEMNRRTPAELAEIARRHAAQRQFDTTVPYADLMPSSDDWPHLTAVRLGGLSSLREPALNRRVRRQLAGDTLPINFEDNRFVNVLDYFRNTTGVNFFVNWQALEQAGVEQNFKITLQVDNTPAEQALQLVLAIVNAAAREPIGYDIIDGVVHVSTRRELMRTTETRVYDIRDVLPLADAMLRRDQANGQPNEQTRNELTRQDAINHLMKLIHDTVGEPGDWDANGGEISSLRELNGNLIVKTTPDCHHEITQILSALRASQGLDAPLEPWRFEPSAGVGELTGADANSDDAEVVASADAESATVDGIPLNELIGVADWPDSSVEAARRRIVDELENTFAAIQYFVATGKFEKADKLLYPILDAVLLANREEERPPETDLPSEREGADRMANAEAAVRLSILRRAVAADHFRVGAFVAEAHGDLPRMLRYLERAMAMEMAALPDDFDLELLRADNVELLEGYERLALALKSIDARPPADFVARIVRAADRLRTVDPYPAQGCFAAARALRAVGQDELAWQYATSALAARPNDAEAWVDLADEAELMRDEKIAERCLTRAFECERTNPQHLWRRAQLLLRHSRADEAAALIRQIAEGDWQQRFRDTVRDAERWLRDRASDGESR